MQYWCHLSVFSDCPHLGQWRWATVVDVGRNVLRSQVVGRRPADNLNLNVPDGIRTSVEIFIVALEPSRKCQTS